MKDGRAYQKSEAFVEAMAALGGVLAAARPLRLCQRVLRDMIYDPIACNRYRWFGERSTCYVPSAEDRARFLA